MSVLKIILGSISEDASGTKYINYSVRKPDGGGTFGRRVPLGGAITV